MNIYTFYRLYSLVGKSYSSTLYTMFTCYMNENALSLIFSESTFAEKVFSLYGDYTLGHRTSSGEHWERCSVKVVFYIDIVK